jgi:hypothetical protein
MTLNSSLSAVNSCLHVVLLRPNLIKFDSGLVEALF